MQPKKKKTCWVKAVKCATYKTILKLSAWLKAAMVMQESTGFAWSDLAISQELECVSTKAVQRQDSCLCDV